MNERVELTSEEAIAMLPDKDIIHTMRTATGIIVGAEYSRTQIVDLINQFGSELSGEQVTAIGHGIALCDDNGWLFIETKEEVADE